MSVFHGSVSDLPVRASLRRVGAKQVMQFVQDLFVRRVAAQQFDHSIHKRQIADRLIMPASYRQLRRAGTGRSLLLPCILDVGWPPLLRRIRQTPVAGCHTAASAFPSPS